MPVIRSRPDAFNEDSTMPTERVRNVNNILDWIASIYGFQVMNISLLLLIFPSIGSCPGYKCWEELGHTLIINPYELGSRFQMLVDLVMQN